MSTKIYDAFKFEGTIQELMQELFLIRDKYWEQRRNDLKEWGCMSLAAILDYDHVTKNIEPYYLKNFRDAKEDIRNKPLYAQDFDTLNKILQAQIQSRLNDPLNFQASVIIYPNEDGIYLQFFGLRDNSEYINDRFTDIHYQNQTDMPEDISEEEWDKRRETWDKIFERNSIPSNTGLSFPLIELENCWEFCYWYWDKENSQNEK
jgi:hypothetical protein